MATRGPSTPTTSAATVRYDRKQRHGDTVRLVLAQIYERAERVRIARRRRSPAVTGKGIDVPMSLIELIQASAAVFERYGIGAPDDAIYHRYLLSLSIDPETDWRKKIAVFRVSDQPRVRRLCSNGLRGMSHLHQSATTEAADVRTRMFNARSGDRQVVLNRSHGILQSPRHRDNQASPSQRESLSRRETEPIGGEPWMDSAQNDDRTGILNRSHGMRTTPRRHAHQSSPSQRDSLSRRGTGSIDGETRISNEQPEELPDVLNRSHGIRSSPRRRDIQASPPRQDAHQRRGSYSRRGTEMVGAELQTHKQRSGDQQVGRYRTPGTRVSPHPLEREPSPSRWESLSPRGSFSPGELVPRDVATRRTPVTSQSNPQHGRQTFIDRFSDVLLMNSPKKKDRAGELVVSEDIRPGSPTRRQVARLAGHRIDVPGGQVRMRGDFDDEHLVTLPVPEYASGRWPDPADLAGVTLARSSLSPPSGEESSAELANRDNDDDTTHNYDPVSDTVTQSQLFEQHPWNSANLQVIVTAFERWKAMHDMRKLVQGSKDQDIRMRRALMPTSAARAIFRWIVLCLPEQFPVQPSAGRDRVIPASIERRIGVAATKNVSTVALFARRLLLHCVRCIIVAWHREAQARSRVRRKSRARRRTEAIDILLKCLHGWRMFTRTKRFFTERANWISYQCARRIRRRMLGHWRQRFQLQQMQLSADRHFKFRLQSLCFTKWTRLVKKQRWLRLATTKMMKIQAIARWQRFMSLRRYIQRQRHTAGQHFRAQLIRSAWKQLNAGVRCLQSYRAKMHHWLVVQQQRLKSNVFRAWKVVSLKNRVTNEWIGKFAKRRRRRDLRQCLVIWANWVDRELSLAVTMSEMSRRQEIRCFATALTTWKHHLEYTRRSDGLKTDQIHMNEKRHIWRSWRRVTALRISVAKTWLAYDQHLVRAAYDSWMAYGKRLSVWRRGVSKCQTNQQRRTLAHCWEGLMHNMRAQKMKKQTAMGLMRQRHTSAVHTVFNRWALWIRTRRQIHARQDTARMTISRQFLLRQMWTTWRKAYRLASLGSLAMRQLGSYRKLHTFRAWKQIVARKHVDRVRIGRAVQQLGLSRTYSVFARWKRLVSKKHANQQNALKAAHIHDGGCLRRCWSAWTLAHSSAQEKSRRVLNVINKWKYQRVSITFHRWKARWMLRKRHRQLLQRCSMAFQGRTVEVFFQAWKRWCKRQSDVKRRCSAASKALEAWKLRRVIHIWHGALRRRGIQNRRLESALAHWQRIGLANPFRRWVDFVACRKKRTSQAAAVITYWRQGLARGCFSIWKLWTQRAKERSSVSEYARQHLQRLRLRRCIERLRSNANFRRRLRSITEHISRFTSHGTSSKYFVLWTTFVASQHARAARDSECHEAMAWCKLRASLRRWGTWTRTRKLVRNSIFRVASLSKTVLLQNCLDGWKQFTKQRALYRALSQKAIVFQAFCLLPACFRGWKLFVQQQARNRDMVLRASRYLCHQLERKAFLTWVEFIRTTKTTRQAVRKWRYKTVAQCFGMWARLVVYQREKNTRRERADCFHTAHLVRGTFRHWKKMAHIRRALRYCTGMLTDRTTREMFGVWRRFSHRQRAARVLMARLKNQSLVRVFNSWKERISFEVERKRTIRERFGALWRANLQDEYWSRWTRFARVRKLVRRWSAERRSTAASEYFRRWEAQTRTQRMIKQRATMVQQLVRSQIARTCWNEWRFRLRAVRCVRAMRGEMLERRNGEQIRLRFERWLWHTRRTASIRALRRRTELRLMGSVFHNGFVAYSRAKIHDKAISDQIRVLHHSFLRDWLATKVEDRIARISASEAMVRSRSWCRLLLTTWKSWLVYHGDQQDKRAARERLELMLTDTGVYNVNHVRKMLGRWLSIDLVRVFEHWRICCLMAQRNRQQTLVAIDRWQSAHCRRVIYAWKQLCAEQKRCRVIDRLSDRCAKKRQFAKWKAWRLHRQFKSAHWTQACTFHVRSAYSNAFSVWKTFARTARSQRKLVVAIYRASCLRRLGALLHKWQAFTIAQRMKRVQCTVARVFYAERLTRKCFTELKGKVRTILVLRQQLQLNTERLQVLLLCSSFRAWRAWSGQHAKLAKLMVHLSAKCQTKTAAQIFRAWRSCTESMIKRKYLADTFRRFRLYRAGVSALKNALFSSQYRRQSLDKAQIFKQVLQGTHVSSVFRRWKTFAALSRKTRLVTLQYLQDKLLPTCWRAWVDAVQRKKKLTSTARSIAATWKNIGLQRAWNALVAYRDYRLAHHSLLSKGDAHFHTRELRDCVRVWRASTAMQRRLASVCRNALMRWQMASVFRCFAAMREYSDMRKHLRKNTTIVSQRVARFRMLSAWCTWREGFLVCRKGNRCNLAHYWRRWLQWRASKVSLGSLQERIYGVMMKGAQQRSFQSWKEFVVRRKIAKTMTLMSCRFASSTMTKRVFDAWRQYLVLLRVSKEKMRKVIAHMQCRAQHAAFRILSMYRDHRHHKRLTTAQALAFRSNRLQLHVFCGWKAAVVAQKQQKERLGYYINMMMNAAQRRSFCSWAAYTARCKELRLKMANSLAMRTQMCRQIVFHGWKQVVTKARRNGKAIEFCNGNISKRALRLWRQFVILSKVERMMGASSSRIQEKAFVAWRKRVVMAKQVYEFLTARQKKREDDIVSACFLEWRQWSSLHVRCKRILSHAANCNHLRFRFHLWKAFTLHHRRLVQLLKPPLSGRDGADNAMQVRADGSTASDTGNDSCSVVHIDDDTGLDAIRQQLAVKARFFQRFEFAWDLPSTWRRWRLAFHAVLFHRLRMLQRYFICWQTVLHHRRRARWIVAALSGRRIQSSVRGVFLAWRNVVQRVKQIQMERHRERQLWTIVNTEMVRRERRELRRHFEAWSAYAQDKRFLQTSADAYHHARLVTRCWLAWRHDYLALAQRLKLRMNEDRRVLEQHALRRGIRALRTHSKSTKRLRLVIEYCTNRRNDREIPQILSRWRRWAHCRRMSVQHYDKVVVDRLRHVITLWKALVRTRHHHRAILQRLLTKRAEGQCWNMWQRWVMFLGKRRRSHRLERVAFEFRARQCLRRRWLARVRERTKRYENALLAADRLVQFRKRRSVRRWQVSARNKSLHRRYVRFCRRKFLRLWRSRVQWAVATRFDAFMLRIRARRMLIEWRRVAHRHRHWRSMIATFVGSHGVQVQRRVWKSWLALVIERRKWRQALEHDTLRVKWATLMRWVDVVSRAVEGREQRLDVAADHFDRVILSRSIRTWRAGTQQQQQRRFVVLSCVIKANALSQRRILAVVLRLWRRHVQMSGASRQMRDKLNIKVRNRHLKAWRAWLRFKKQRYRRQHEAEQYYARRLMSATFFYWQNYALAWLDASKQHVVIKPWEPKQQQQQQDKPKVEGEEMHRRPMSPVMKRLKGKKVAGKPSTIIPAEEKRDQSRPVQGLSDWDRGEYDHDRSEVPLLSLPDAVSLSVGVKKRLTVLGQWHPPRRTLLPQPSTEDA